MIHDTRRNGYGPLQVYGILLRADPAERQPVGKSRSPLAVRTDQSGAATTVQIQYQVT